MVMEGIEFFHMTLLTIVIVSSFFFFFDQKPSKSHETTTLILRRSAGWICPIAYFSSQFETLFLTSIFSTFPAIYLLEQSS